jgi:predicted acylesterase/phospholipase RssA
MIVSKNATTGDTWFFVNSQNNKFAQDNAALPLWQIIRASSAAPTYFPPRSLHVANTSNEFIDGGMSSYNNPSFQLFLEATQPAYGIGWTPGEQNILLISVGTGFSSEKIPYPKARSYKALNWAPYAIGSFMDSANLQQNTLMQLMSQRRPDKKTESTTDFISDHFKSLLTYHRYTISFSRERFKRLHLDDINVDKVQALDCIDQIPALQRIGQAIAREQVQEDDFKGFFDDDA